MLNSLLDDNRHFENDFNVGIIDSHFNRFMYVLPFVFDVYCIAFLTSLNLQMFFKFDSVI